MAPNGGKSPGDPGPFDEIKLKQPLQVVSLPPKPTLRNAASSWGLSGTSIPFICLSTLHPRFRDQSAGYRPAFGSVL